MTARPRVLPVVTTGFGIAVVMWTIGYLLRLPGAILPGVVILLLMLLAVVAGGAFLRRHAAMGITGAAVAGLVAGAVNLLILGSFLTDADKALVPSRLLWVPGSFLVTAALAALGAKLVRAREPWSAATWRTCFLAIGVLATLLVVVAGGFVTSAEEGLAVPDWPNSFQTNMFLYPIALMNGGIYYEHAHRLAGSLAGLTTVAIAIAIWRTSMPATERTLRWLALLLVAMVVGQGVMGGLRVTETNLSLAIVHGIFGQVFLATMSIAWAMSTHAWRQVSSSSRGGVIAWVMLAVVGLQLTTGALARHLYTEETPMPWPTHIHLTLAVIVAMLALHVALRSWARGRGVMLRRFGMTMFVVIGLQLLLGFVALAVVIARQGGPNVWEIVVTTLHQVNGALVLLAATQLALWTHRVGLNAPAPDTEIAPA